METTYFRFMQEESDKQKTFNNGLLTVVGINVLFFLMLLYFNNDIANFMLYEGHNEYIILLGVIVGIDAITALPLAKLRSEEKALKFAKRSNSPYYYLTALSNAGSFDNKKAPYYFHLQHQQFRKYFHKKF